MLTRWQRQGGPLRLVVTGWSMAPLLHPGDTVVLVPPEGELGPGTIVTVQQAGSLLTHRVLRQTSTGLLLRGDACRQPDPLVAVHEIVGVVALRERPGRPSLSVRQGLLGLIGRLVVVGPAPVIGLRALWLRILWVIGLGVCAIRNQVYE
ncbi:MAG: S24/S26 family peptidase [Oscillochloridaceae bacterium umkhey_bin13]